MDARAVVLVEGRSDREAVEALARRRGRALAAEGVAVVPVGGVQAIGRCVRQLLDERPEVRLAGLYDAPEEHEVRRGLALSGVGPAGTRAELERLGFFVCVADLEEELIRAHGAAAVERVLEEHGDLRAFRTLQKQPEWRGRRTEEQLRRFMGSGGSRKVRYARLLVEALEPERVPRPLDRVLAHVLS